MSLFEQNLQLNQPLAERMRPGSLGQYIGHEKIIGENTLLRNMIENDELVSLIFWAPPGCGKTTLAHIIASHTQSEFVSFSAASQGIKDLRIIIQKAKDQLELHQKRTILFVDEIHRFNKSQQDYFLPFVEKGIIVLIGATTENPSFEVNSALLSRCRVFRFEKLTGQNIADLLVQAIKDKKNGYGNKRIKISKELITYIAKISNGDARNAYNTLEFAVKATKPEKNGDILVTDETVKQALQKNYLLYDKDGEQHYDIISALHKSLRGSDVDAALYWLGRMLEAGENPLYIARRLIRFASEDIGMADSQALVIATNCYHACHFIGMPECGVNLAHCVVYLAQAQKSVAVYKAYKNVKHDVLQTINDSVPLHLRNAPTQLMKDLDYGKGYKYNPDYDGKVEQDYLPKSLLGKKYYDENK